MNMLTDTIFNSLYGKLTYPEISQLMNDVLEEFADLKTNITLVQRDELLQKIDDQKANFRRSVGNQIGDSARFVGNQAIEATKSGVRSLGNKFSRSKSGQKSSEEKAEKMNTVLPGNSVGSSFGGKKTKKKRNRTKRRKIRAKKRTRAKKGKNGTKHRS